MKTSHYDVLQISSKALPEVISAAYQNLKPVLLDKASLGDEDARNQLLFIEEAYSVLSSPQKRSAYDEWLSMASSGAPSAQRLGYSPQYEPHSTFLSWWGDSKTSRFLLAIALLSAVFAIYKFTGQSGEQKLLNRQLADQQETETGKVQNDAYRAESERFLIQGAVANQGNLIDKSHNIAAQEAERRRLELEYRANAGSQQLEMQRQRQEAQLQEQKWRQEQYEKDRQMREARAAADAPKRQLCNMYALNGNVADARAAGCY